MTKITSNRYKTSIDQEIFKISGFVSRGLTFMTKSLTAKLAEISVSSTHHIHDFDHAEEPKKKKHGHHHHHHHKHHHHIHNHHKHHRPHHHVEDEESEIPPLSLEEFAEFNAVGQHIENLRKMHPHLRRMLYSKMHHVHVKSGGVVIKQGEPSDSWYILLSGSLQCIVSPEVGAIPKKYKTDQKKDKLLQQGKNIKAMDEMQNHCDENILGENVHYYYGHGKHITGTVVSVFHPGDSFGETCFEFAEEMVIHTLRENMDNEQDDDNDGEDGGKRSRSNSTLSSRSVDKSPSQSPLFDSNNIEDHLYPSKQVVENHRHPHDKLATKIEPIPPPTQATRTASVVALESAELLKVTLEDFLDIQLIHQRWLLDQIFECLRDLTLFNHLNDVDLEKLARHCKLHRVGRNQIVLASNQSLSCYIVMQGSLRVLLKHESSENKPCILELGRLGPNSTFGGALLARGCTKAGNGVSLITSSCTVLNQIIEIESMIFFNLVIRQNMETRKKWVSALMPALLKGFRLEKVKRHNHYVTRPVIVNKYFSNSLNTDVGWKQFKNNMVETLHCDKANGGTIGNAGGRIPTIFRVRECAPIGHKFSAKGRQRESIRVKRHENFIKAQRFRIKKDNIEGGGRKGGAGEGDSRERCTAEKEDNQTTDKNGKQKDNSVFKKNMKKFNHNKIKFVNRHQRNNNKIKTYHQHQSTWKREYKPRITNKNVDIYAMSRPLHPPRQVDPNELLMKATNIQSKGGALMDFARKVDDRLQKAGERYSTLTPEQAEAIALATNTKIVSIRKSETTNNTLILPASRAKSVNDVPYWWESREKKKMFMAQKMQNRETQKKDSVQQSLNFPSRSVGSVAGIKQKSPKRPYSTVSPIKRHPSPRVMTRKLQQEKEEYDDGDKIRWIPTRRVVEEQESHGGRKFFNTGKWHAGLVLDD